MGLPGQRRRRPGRLRRAATAAAEEEPDAGHSRSTRKFVALQKLLDAAEGGDGFKPYDELSKPEVKELSDAVNALSEPLSKLAAAVI